MKYLHTQPIVEDDKNSLLPSDVQDASPTEIESVSAAPKMEGYLKPDYEPGHFLTAPVVMPVRPLSPDTFSNLSVDEYDQLHPSRRPSQVEIPSFPPRRGWRGRLEASWIRNKGLAFMLLAQVFGTLMNITTRLLEIEGNKGKGLHPVQILFARMGITMILATAYMWYRRTPHFPFGMPEVRWLLMARGFGGFFGVFGMYYSLLYLPLADATVITFLAPGMACWACSILLKEPFTRVERIGTLISFLGVIFIAKPTTLLQALGGSAPAAGGGGEVATPGGNVTSSTGGPDAANYDGVTPAQQLSGVGMALVGVCGATVAYTTIRWIGKRAHPLISVNYFATWCTIVSTVLQMVLPGIGFLLPADLKEWGYLIFLGTCGFVMQFLLAAGLSYEKSSRATNMTYTQMLFALGADKLIFGHSPSILSILGSSLILGSAIVVALQKSTGSEVTSTAANDESRAGLLRDVETGEDHDRMPVQEVQLRTLR